MHNFCHCTSIIKVSVASEDTTLLIHHGIHGTFTPLAEKNDGSQNMADLRCTFRIAESCDFDEIVKLSNDIFSTGRDYLQLRLSRWLQMDNLAVMLAFVEQRLVGLQACFIVDDGRTFIRQAMRIVPEFRGNGLSRELSEAMDAYVRCNFPNVCRLRFTNYLYREFSTPTRMVLELGSIAYKIETENNRPLKVPSGNSMEIVSCSKEYFSDVILSRPFSHKLFPHDILLVDWCPYQALTSNIDYILQERDFLLVDKCADDGIPRSFSFGRLSTKVAVVEWIVAVYTDDPGLFEAHIMHQCKHACDIIKGGFSFVSFQDKGFRGLGQKLLGERLHLKHDEFYDNESLFLYERDFGKQGMNGYEPRIDACM